MHGLSDESPRVRAHVPPHPCPARAPTGAGEKGRTAHAEGRTKDGDERRQGTREGTSTALLCPAEIVDGKTATPAVQRTVAKLTADNVRSPNSPPFQRRIEEMTDATPLVSSTPHDEKKLRIHTDINKGSESRRVVSDDCLPFEKGNPIDSPTLAPKRLSTGTSWQVRNPCPGQQFPDNTKRLNGGIQQHFAATTKENPANSEIRIQNGSHEVVSKNAHPLTAARANFTNADTVTAQKPATGLSSTTARSQSTNTARAKLNPVHQPKQIKPLMYVALSLERSEDVKSWGFVFSKENCSFAHILRVSPPATESDGPKVNWCRITTQRPSPTSVYRQRISASGGPVPLPDFESVMRAGISPSMGTSVVPQLMQAEYLLPGDALISLDGFPMNQFNSTQKLAAYIRQHNTRRMLIVVIRHEAVWRSAVSQNALPSTNPGDVIKASWQKVLGNSNKRKSTSHEPAAKRPKVEYRNSMFKDENGVAILYCDNNNDEIDPDEGKHIRKFANDQCERNFYQWLSERKETWRQSRNHVPLEPIHNERSLGMIDVAEDDLPSTLEPDFWLASGFESFEDWLDSSKTKWRRTYSWHRRRLTALQKKAEADVSLPTGNCMSINQVEKWLASRKVGWRLTRRKRQLLQLERYLESGEDENDSNSSSSLIRNSSVAPSVARHLDTTYMDEILESRQERPMDTGPRKPLDISWMFEAARGCPDDVVVNIMQYLLPRDHGNLLCLSFTSNDFFKRRDSVWRDLCPSHWILPRRPRRSWASVYITKIRAEEDAARKKNDDILVKASVIIGKADQLLKLQKLLKKYRVSAVGDFEFGGSLSDFACLLYQ